MAPGKLFERNVRPQSTGYDDDVEDDDVGLSSVEGTGSEHSDEDEHMVEGGDSEGSGDVATGDDEDEEEDAEKVTDRIKNVSFGALKQAQDSISRKRKRGSDNNPDQEDKLEALRERLRQIRKDKERQDPKQKKKSAADTKRRPHGASDPDADSDASDSAPSEHDRPRHARTSKHAPMSQTSKRQVTRRRQVVDIPRRQTRDPRFDAVAPDPNPQNAHSRERAYAFLREYQQSEIAELQAALKRTRSEDDRTVLRRKLVSMQNTLKTKAAAEREREVVRAHRRAEREAVSQGKTPYFLKQKEVKGRALVEKFKGMKAKEREKVIEKKTLKESQREKRRMPEGRRRQVG